VQFRNTLQDALSVALPTTFAFDHPTIRDIVHLIASDTDEDRPAMAGAAPPLCSVYDKSTGSHPTAVTGWSCRLAGMSSPDELWSGLMAGTDFVGMVPSSRSIPQLPDGVTADLTLHGSFLQELGGGMPAFEISEAEASAMSPQQRLMLDVGYEAITSAGHNKDSVRDQQAGVFIGVGIHGSGNLEGGTGLALAAEPFLASGASAAIVANRLSFCLKISGASLSLDTACSSALVALDVGCHYLRSQLCTAALCGGVQVVDLLASIVMNLAHELSTLGRCATFDEAADGFARGEGCGAVWLTAKDPQNEK